MKASTSTKSSSKRTGAVKATKAPAKRSTKQKPRWKIIGDMVHITPGDYTAEDFEAMIKALQVKVSKS